MYCNIEFRKDRDEQVLVVTAITKMDSFVVTVGMVDNYFSSKSCLFSFQPIFLFQLTTGFALAIPLATIKDRLQRSASERPMWTSSKPAKSAECLAYIADIKPFTLEGDMEIDVTRNCFEKAREI